MRSSTNFLSASVLKCPFVISKIFLSCFHDSQPIPFDNNLLVSKGGLKRLGSFNLFDDPLEATYTVKIQVVGLEAGGIPHESSRF